MVTKNFIQLILFFASTIVVSVNCFDNCTLLKTLDNGFKMYVSEVANDVINKPIDDGLTAYNIAQTGESEIENCTVVVQTKSGEIVGGLVGYIVQEENRPAVCTINDFWVDDSRKGVGFESKIIGALINHLKSVQCFIIEAMAWDYQGDRKAVLESWGFKAIAMIPNPPHVIDAQGYAMRLYFQNTEIYYSPYIDDKHEVFVQACWSPKYSQVIGDCADAQMTLQAGTSFVFPYTIFLTSATGEIVAGGIGRCVESKKLGTCCYLNRFWVDEKYRKHGFGTKVMDAVADHAKGKNCTLVQLDTWQWQAKGFYGKCGFEVIAAVPDFDGCTGFEQYYMRKVL
jgi:GNAT superfamily N-acetyltransferase